MLALVFLHIEKSIPMWYNGCRLLMYFSDGSFLFWDEFGDVGNWDFNTQNESILIYSALEVGRFLFSF